MKKVLFLLFVASLFVGCEKAGVGSRGTIGFVCEADEATRATESVEVDDLTISIMGYATSESDIFINDLALENSGNSWSFTGDDADTEWPESGTVDFYAYSPSSYTASGSVSGNPLSISYSVNSSVKDQDDLMTATALGYSSGVVPLKFEHQLSCILFGIIQNTADDGVKYSITDISLSGVYSSGTLVVDDGGECSWSGQGTTASYALSNGTDGLLYADPDDYPSYSVGSLVVVNTTDGYMKLLPQTLPTNAQLTITYISSASDSTSKTATLDLGGVEWVAGEQYIYTMTFGSKEVSFSTITVSEWVSEDESTLDESLGVVNMQLYDDITTLKSVLTTFSYFSIRNISVLGTYFDGCIGDMTYSVDLGSVTSSTTNFESNSPYVSILLDLETLDIGSIDFTDTDNENVTATPVMAFSPGFSVSYSGGEYTFSLLYSKSALHMVVLPSHITTISTFSFAYSAIEQASYSNITTVEEYAFLSCTELRNVVLPAVTSIGDYAFYGCTSLSNVALPYDVTLGSNTFKDVDTSDCELMLYCSSSEQSVTGTSWGGYSWKSVTSIVNE